jgi:hypothetical protein
MKKLKLTESQLKYIVNNLLNEGMGEIDQILDKINKSGMSSLTDKEKKYLDHYSMNNEFLDNEELTTTKSVADQGETWVFEGQEGIPSMNFKYESTEENVDEILHSGYLNVNNDEYYGEIYCDTEGTYSLCNFESAEGENVFERYEGLEHEIGTFLSIVCNDLKGDLKS